MIYKSLFSFRKSAAAERGQGDDAGMIVILMMALVFVPVAVAHLAVMWPGAGAQQLAGIVNVLLRTF